MNVLSLFDGMACGMLALLKAGIQVNNYYAYEIDKYAVQTAKHNFPDIQEFGDVFNADFTKYHGIDYLIGGSPCFTKGHYVLTDKGYKDVSDIQVGDMVLTHKGRYKKVVRTNEREANIVDVKIMGYPTFHTTAEHPFYTLERRKATWDEYKETKSWRVFSTEPKWVKVLDLKPKTHFCGQHIGKSAEINATGIDTELAYILGRYVADGHIRKSKRPGRPNSYQYQVILSIGANKIERFKKNVTRRHFSCYEHSKSVYRVCFSSMELLNFIEQQGFGKGANSKTIPEFIYNMPRNIQLAFLSGYMDGDGHKGECQNQAATVSPELAFGLQRLITQLYSVNVGVTVSNNNRPHKIGGREIHSNYPLYTVVWKESIKKQSVAHIQDGIVWTQVKNVCKTSHTDTVYNIEVEDDNSYTVNNCIVHNCTYWSIAQSPDKRETTASGIGWELFSQYVRALHEAKPRYFIYENNKSMAKAIYNSISETFGFEPIMINSALVSAQNRQRYYWVGKRNDDGTYSKVDIEQPEDRGILLRDVLDGIALKDKQNCIDANYYKGGNYTNPKKQSGQRMCAAEPVNVTDNGKSQTIKAQYSKTSTVNVCCYDSTYGATGVAEPVACRCRGRTDKNGNGYAKYECRNDGKANTLDTNTVNGAMVAEPVDKPIRVGVYPTSDGRMLNSQGMRIYSIDGKSVTQSAQGGGMGAKTGLYAIPIEFDGGIPTKAVSCADGKTYDVYEVKNGLIMIKGKTYPIKLFDGYYIIRKLTVSECKRLQTVPEWYEFSYCVNQTQFFGEEVEICKNAKLRDAISLLQAEKLNYVTNIILGSCDTELRSLLESMLTTLRSVKKKGVNENAKLYKVTASSTIKSGNENSPLIQQENALFVTNRLDMQDATECVLSITTNGSDTGTLCIPRKDNVSLMEILGVNTTKQLTENGFIELLQKKCSEENSQKMKLFIISTLISWIMIRTIYMFATTKPIYVCIGSWNEWRQHLLTMDLLYLKTGNIGGVSNSAAYKMLGNGWTVDVIAHLLKYMV